LSGEALDLLQALKSALDAKGKKLPINVDGAIAAILVDLGIPSPLANAFFFMARIPGLVAHVHEELSRERPMRRVHPTAHAYDGPAPRSLEK
jgi:citrate synthase